jgi:hypothetical protein
MGAALAARHRFAVSLALVWLLAGDDSAGLMTLRCAPIAARSGWPSVCDVTVVCRLCCVASREIEVADFPGGRQHGRMGSITNRVTGELLHHVRTRRAGVNSVEREYRRQPFRVARPADGQPPAGGETVCETCGESVRYRITSAGSTLRRRRIWLVVALAGVVFGVASFVLLFWQIEGFDGWPVLGFAAGGGVFIGVLITRVTEDGVRVGRQRGTRRHIVRSGAMNTEGHQQR